MKRTVIICICLSVFFTACGKLTGQFAYKTAEMDAYRQMTDDMEFSSDAPVDWVYSLDGVSGKRRVYILVQKKELVWADVMKDSADVDKSSPWIHGRIEKLEPGEYTIVLAEKDKRIAVKPFVIYAPADADSDDDDSDNEQ